MNITNNTSTNNDSIDSILETISIICSLIALCGFCLTSFCRSYSQGDNNNNYSDNNTNSKNNDYGDMEEKI